MTEYIEYQSIDGNVHKIRYDDQIETINLSDKKISKIIKIGEFSNLVELNLSKNMINKIEGLDHLHSLEKLLLERNHINKIEGLNHLCSLQILDLRNNRIDRIEGLEQLSYLEYLYLARNKISKIEGLDTLLSLQELDLSCNNIIRIEGLDELSFLKELNLCWNEIIRIEGLEQLHHIVHLYLNHNKIKKIEGVEKLSNLSTLWLDCNQIKQIEGLVNQSSLETLFLDNNQIEMIEGTNNLTKLIDLHLNENFITTVPMTIMNLNNLFNLYVDDDVQINPIIRRFLDRNMVRSERTVYDDPQNVHDSQINRSICSSLYRLMETKNTITEEKTMQEIINDSILTEPVKQQIVEYTHITDVHSKLNCTFMEALQIVWQTIQSHKQSAEIKKVLNQEMQDSICRCFTGRLYRLINCLCGFDQRVQIQISDQQEIANLIIAIKKKTDQTDQQIMMVRKELSERGYDNQTIAEWIGYLE
jgi:hypothetical protein